MKLRIGSNQGSLRQEKKKKAWRNSQADHLALDDDI